MSARTQLRAALTEALPNWRVTGARGILDAATKPSIGVWQSSMARVSEWQWDHVRVELEVWVVVPTEDPDKADDALDDALEELLGALHPLEWVDWTSAERGVLADSLHGYKVAVVMVAKIGD